MSQNYILDLTNHLITKNKYAHLFRLGRHGLIEHIKLDLECNDVREMKPETLGKIMSAFQIGDVMVTKEEIFKLVHFSGDCEEFLREIVATCLANAISDRILGNEINLPPYRPR